MTISFTPALGEIVRIPVSYDAGIVRLSFTAVLFVREYREIERKGAKLQVWANIPVLGQLPGSWGAYDFQDAQLSDDDASRGESEDELDFDQSYSFTYRALYPTGEIRWLGKSDTNGAFTFRRHRHRAVAYQTSVQPNPVGDVIPNQEDKHNATSESLEYTILDDQLSPMDHSPKGQNSMLPDIEEEVSKLPLHTSQWSNSTLSTIEEEVQDNGVSAIPEHTATQQERYPNLSSTSALCTPRRPRYIQSMPAISSLSRRPRIPRKAPEPFYTARSPPTPPLPPSIEDGVDDVPAVPRNVPLMLWGWILDEDIFEPGTRPICTSLSERYERFLDAIKTAQVGEGARFKGFVSTNRMGQPMSQFCFYFASNRSVKEKKKRLSVDDVRKFMETAGTRRWPCWLEIPGSGSPSYLEVRHVPSRF